MSTKSCLLFSAILVATICGCGSPNYAERFNYPAAFVVVAGDFNHAKVRFAGNVLKNRSGDSFGSAWLSVDTTGESRHSARWDFVKKTPDGDVYLFHIHSEGLPDTVVPVLFSGKPITVVSNADIFVRIAIREDSR